MAKTLENYQRSPHPLPPPEQMQTNKSTPVETPAPTEAPVSKMVPDKTEEKATNHLHS